jgi:hypothetical protein
LKLAERMANYPSLRRGAATAFDIFGVSTG